MSGPTVTMSRRSFAALAGSITAAGTSRRARAEAKPLAINPTGAIGALLMEIGVPPSIMRAIAVISRCGGLAAPIMEKRQNKSARGIWKLTEENISYAAR